MSRRSRGGSIAVYSADWRVLAQKTRHTVDTSIGPPVRADRANLWVSTVTGMRILLLVMTVLAVLPGPGKADGDGRSPRRPRLIDAVRIRQLAEILRSDPDERRRWAAMQELGNADPRVHPDVMPSLIAALRGNAASIRASAAEIIGRFHTVFPLAGAALENAAETDPSPVVRQAAKQSLWEYHLNGFKSVRGTELFLTQTVEPPIAKPELPRQPSAVAPLPPPPVPVVRVTASIPLTAIALPPVSAPGPRVSNFRPTSDPLSILKGSRQARLTREPPIAKPKQPRLLTPPRTTEPPILKLWPEPVVIGHSPAFSLDLPPVVTPPNAK